MIMTICGKKNKVKVRIRNGGRERDSEEGRADGERERGKEIKQGGKRVREGE